VTDRRPILLRLGDGERVLDLDEALIVRDWLRTTRVTAAQRLGSRLSRAIEAQDAEPLDLDPDELDALRGILSDTDVGPHRGLEALRRALVGPRDSG
jgi:hypothetical protein